MPFSVSRPTDRDRRGTPFYAALGGLLLLLSALAARPAAAQFRDIGYTFEPIVQGVFEDDQAPIETSALYGGALGLSFGRHFEASAEYLVNNGVSTNFSNVDRLAGLIDQDIDTRRYGARIRFNLYDRRVIPYLTAGSGVMQFDPEQVERTRTIYGTYGAGITFSAYDRYRISLSGEIMNYRYDPVATFLGPGGSSDFEQGTTLVTSPSLSASVSLFLGGRSLEEQTAVDRALEEQFGGPGLLRGVQLSVRPFHGRIEFNDALGFPQDQNVAGINAGISLGPFVDLQGFYWRGTEGASFTEDVVGGFDDIQMYGGELDFRLNFELGRGFVPYAKVGGGYLDVLGGFEDDIPANTSPPEDRFFGITGAGLEVPLTRSIKLSGGARGLFMDNPNVEEAGDPGDIFGSLMYTAGVEFRLGGGGRTEQPEPVPQPTPLFARDDSTEPGEQAAPDEQMPAAEQTEMEQLRARADSLETVLATLQSDRVAPPASQPADTSTVRVSRTPQSTQTGRTMMVPVPEQGEIYIRFGEAAPTAQTQPSQPTTEARPQQQAVPDDVEQRVREALRQELQQQGRADTAQALTDADVNRMIQRTVREVMREQRQQDTEAAQQRQETENARRQQTEQSQQIQRLQNQINELQRELQEERQQESDVRREVDTRSEPASAPGSSQPFYRQTLGRPLTYLVPITGFRVGGGESQFQIGVRGDYRSTPTSRFHLLPELSFGIGGGQLSPTVLFSGAYSFLRDRTSNLVGLPLEPYVGLGVGIASTGGFTFEPVTNAMVGVNYRFTSGRRLFLEYSAFGFSAIHRVHVGFRVGL